MPPKQPSTLIDILWFMALTAGAIFIALPEWSRPRVDEFGTTPQHQQAMTEMEEVGTAMFAYLLDQSLPRTVPPRGLSCGTVEVTDVPTVTHTALESLLVPTYLAALPELDPWGQPYEFRLASALDSPFAAIRSAGSDGLFEATLYSVGYTAGPADDLVWYDYYWARRLGPSGDLERQTEAVAQIQSVGTAMFSWLTDQIPRPISPSDAPYPLGPSIDLADYFSTDQASLALLLVPTYIHCVPDQDPWGHPYEYWIDTVGLGQPFAAIRSTGADGLAESTVYPVATFPGDEFDRDLVWADGFWVSSPDTSHATVFSDGFELGLWGVWSTSP